MDINSIVSGLTLEQKAALLQGWTTWTTLDLSEKGIPPMFMSDGPVGLRKQAGAGDHLGLNASVPATCFPTAATMANSWDVSLGEELGRTLGAEAAANDVHVVLGPSLNIKRSPLCGRNFEYFSEDPYLSGKMAASYIKGIQSYGVAACPKHFAVNSQELRRMSMDSVLDERTMREIYLTGFEMAVKEGGAKALMSSYNMVNGTYANENAHLLSDILRGEWGFDGYVVTDWGGDNNHTEGVRAGGNLVMPAPGPDCAIGLIEDVKAGKIDESVLDQRVEELLRIVFMTQEDVAKQPKSFDVEAHHAVARRCAEGSIVLLDNDGILPLNEGASVAIIGDFAKTPRYQGAGSSQVNATKIDNLYDSLEKYLNITGYAQGFDRKDPNPIDKLISEAVEVAKKAETVLLCVGLDEILESEGMDRLHMELSKSQQKLINEVCAVNKNIILVLSGGAPFVMPDRSLYRAAIHGYLGGQAGAGAMADAIIGKVNPSGKLNESWPHRLEDNPSYPYFPSKERTAEYREGLFVGYRYYDTAGKSVRYPFGHGISYTDFDYSDIKADKNSVSFTISNVGKVDGAEVAQVYISCKNGNVYRPKKELKGFAKVFLKAGESKTVTVELDDKAFRYYNAEKNCWEIEDADYEIIVGSSVCDVRLSATIHIDGMKCERSAPECYYNADIENVSDSDFEKLLLRPIPDGSWSGLLTENDAICQLYYAKCGLARLVYKILTNIKNKSEAKGKPDLNVLFIYNMPFRAIGKMAGGMVSRKMVDDILFIVNGHFFRGLGRVIADFFRNLRSNSKFVANIK
ncbi:MAG: glycoside hydrolase family 3 C-terminal domain-containing protein [Clostridia bacterium]|nr:glycoside hydrolase family 3 C-terminal domain-containing protein [Clostridia bacterium]